MIRRERFNARVYLAKSYQLPATTYSEYPADGRYLSLDRSLCSPSVEVTSQPRDGVTASSLIERVELDFLSRLILATVLDEIRLPAPTRIDEHI